MTGWKPIPLPLKVGAILMALWMLGSAMNAANLMQNGLPFLGGFVFGTTALIIVLVLDFVGPLGFFYALWNRLAWGPKWAAVFTGFFILNSLIAVATLSGELGAGPIMVPIVVYAILLGIILWKRAYFQNP